MGRRVRNWLIWLTLVWSAYFIGTSNAPLAYGLAVLLLLSFTVAGWFFFRHIVPLRKAEAGFPYVYVEKDGSVRELSGDEVVYLSTEFSPGDGGRPSIKARYDEKNGWGHISGFILRRRVPARISIARCFSTIVTASPT